MLQSAGEVLAQGDVLAEGDVLARFGHALSDPTRARVLLALRHAPAFPADLASQLGVSRQSMSNHLSCLRGCGLVVVVPQGRRQRYELADAHLAHALSDLLDVILVAAPGHQPDAVTNGATSRDRQGMTDDRITH